MASTGHVLLPVGTVFDQPRSILPLFSDALGWTSANRAIVTISAVATKNQDQGGCMGAPLGRNLRGQSAHAGASPLDGDDRMNSGANDLADSLAAIIPHMMRIAAMCALAVVVTLVALGACAAATYSGEIRVSGARPAEKVLLENLLGQMQPNLVQTITFSTLPRAGQPSLKPGTVRMVIDAGASMEGHWQADVLIRRYVAFASFEGLRQVLGFHPPQRTTQPADIRIDLAPVRRLATRAGVRLVEARGLLGVAVAVVVQSNDPAAFLQRYGRASVTAIHEPQPQAASFFAVEDRSGEVVYEAGAMSAAGFFRAQPGLVSCGPIVTSGVPGQPVTPCPA